MRLAGRLLPVILLAALLGACGDDGGLAELEADPVVTMDVAGAHETAVRSEAGGRRLGKDTPARLFRVLELEPDADPDAVLAVAVSGAQDAGWTFEREGNVAERTARLSRTSGGHELSLFVDLSEPPVLQLSLSTS